MSAAPAEQRGSEAKRRSHGMLKLYYGLPDPSGEASAGAGRGGELGGPTDINGPPLRPRSLPHQAMNFAMCLARFSVDYITIEYREEQY